MKSLKAFLESQERDFLRSALAEADGNISLCARNLEISRMSLYRKMGAYGIKAPRPRAMPLIGQRWKMRVESPDGQSIVTGKVTDISRKVVEIDNSGEYFSLSDIDFVELVPSDE